MIISFYHFKDFFSFIKYLIIVKFYFRSFFFKRFIPCPSSMSSKLFWTGPTCLGHRSKNRKTLIFPVQNHGSMNSQFHKLKEKCSFFFLQLLQCSQISMSIVFLLQNHLCKIMCFISAIILHCFLMRNLNPSINGQLCF